MIEITALFCYNLSMKTKERSPAEWRALLDKKEDEIAFLHRQIDWLTQQLRLARGQRFGASSEQTQAILEQVSLFQEAESESCAKMPEPELEQVTYKRRKQKGKRELDFSGLPVEQVIHELPEAEQVCLECGGKLHACGHEVLRRELAYVPAQYKVVEHVQTVYACRCCERNSDHVFLRKSEVPAPLIPGSGVASPSLLAHIMNSKYTLALPLYRQEQELQRRGLSISRQTMSNWIIYAYQHYFPSLFHALHQELLKSEILHADETTLTVLRRMAGRPGKRVMCGYIGHPAMR